jgi:hypothetical protein
VTKLDSQARVHLISDNGQGATRSFDTVEEAVSEAQHWSGQYGCLVDVWGPERASEIDGLPTRDLVGSFRNGKKQ